MKHIAAYLLASLSGQQVTKESITKILASVGIDSDAEFLDRFFDGIDGKNTEEIIAHGRSLFASMPSGSSSAAPASAAAPAQAKVEEKPEEKEESDEDMGFSLFD